ncbi:2-thiouracil desulfurase family protein, partial [Bordetella pertussis]
MHRVRASIHTGQSSAARPRRQAERRVVAVCPEVAGGLPTPRPPAEIAAG